MSSPAPTLTPSREPSPDIPYQPDHFYGSSDQSRLPPTPHSNGRTWLSPEDDPLAQRGIPVFKPTMEEFIDFEGFVSKIECWGQKSGIVKIIPPDEWAESLPSIKEPLSNIKIKNPIEQHMMGRGGLFRQENVEKRRHLSVREWADLCAKDEYRAPSVDEVDIHSRRSRGAAVKRVKSNAAPAAAKVELEEASLATPAPTPRPDEEHEDSKAAKRHEKAIKDEAFIKAFAPREDWLPPETIADDYNPENCSMLERYYWRTCGFGKPAWYGADCQGSLFSDKVTSWNVARLPSALSRLLPASQGGLPGVNTPYLYFGMWRATFAWHVEDMDLFSINYIHFGAPKFWYAIPQGRANALEQTMRGYFPKDTSQCPQFLRHKSFLASPTLLAQSSCRPNTLVQKQGEIVITFPRGYHAGFNLGFNCAESVNFALESWIELGLKAQACNCIPDSVRIDVQALLWEREQENVGFESPHHVPLETLPTSDSQETEVPPHSRKRKADGFTHSDLPKGKKAKGPTRSLQPKLTLKLGRAPSSAEEAGQLYPCCLCTSTDRADLLRVIDPPVDKVARDAAGHPRRWMAHRLCASLVPETWVDDIEVPSVDGSGLVVTETVVFGVDAIVKDRWSLKCASCHLPRDKAHGAPIQCTRGKCPKSFHVSCAQSEDSRVDFSITGRIEREVVFVEPSPLVQEYEYHNTIEKLAFELLCPQHNPTATAAKKASKQDKIKKQLLSLPELARIKIRVSSGVFEVTLCRIIEETGSVEVLWDRGIKREFKWSSVIFGKTEGPVSHFDLVGSPASDPNGIIETPWQPQGVYTPYAQPLHAAPSSTRRYTPYSTTLSRQPTVACAES